MMIATEWGTRVKRCMDVVYILETMQTVAHDWDETENEEVPSAIAAIVNGIGMGDYLDQVLTDAQMEKLRVRGLA